MKSWVAVRDGGRCRGSGGRGPGAAAGQGRQWARRLSTRTPRRAGFAKAVRLLGAHSVIPEDAILEVEAEFSTMALHAVIEPWIEWCDVVLTHWHEDVRQTHRAIARVVEIATRPFPAGTATLSSSRCRPLPTKATATPPAQPVRAGREERHVARKAAAMAVYTTEQCAGRSAESVRRRVLLMRAGAGGWI